MVVVTRADRLREWSQGELWLYTILMLEGSVAKFSNNQELSSWEIEDHIDNCKLQSLMEAFHRRPIEQYLQIFVNFFNWNKHLFPHYSTSEHSWAGLDSSATPGHALTLLKVCTPTCPYKESITGECYPVGMVHICHTTCKPEINIKNIIVMSQAKPSPVGRGWGLLHGIFSVGAWLGNLFQSKMFNFMVAFSDLASEIHTHFQIRFQTLRPKLLKSRPYFRLKLQ